MTAPKHTAGQYQRRDSQRWHELECGRATPDADEQRLIDAVAAAVDSGLFYSDEVFTHVAAALGDWLPPNAGGPDDMTRSIRTERGDNGMEVYYARRVLDRTRKLARDREIIDHLTIGQEFKNLSFVVNYKRRKYTRGIVSALDRQHGTVSLAVIGRGRGANGIMTMGAAILAREAGL